MPNINEVVDQYRRMIESRDLQIGEPVFRTASGVDTSPLVRTITQLIQMPYGSVGIHQTISYLIPTEQGREAWKKTGLITASELPNEVNLASSWVDVSYSGKLYIYFYVFPDSDRVQSHERAYNGMEYVKAFQQILAFASRQPGVDSRIANTTRS